jgi:phosphoribosylanthranilate isomerase
VAESGLYTVADVERLERVGADAFLIGHALLKSRDPGDTVAVLGGRRAENAPLVKICGITNGDDARQASEAGADLLGLIFARSPRQVDLEQAAAIRSAVPGARLVGVFRDHAPGDVLAAVRAADLDLIQLHGSESPAYGDEVSHAAGVPLIRALTPAEVDDDTMARHPEAAYFLVDPPKGTAATARGEVLAAAARLSRAGARVLLAGGLGPDDVAGALAEAHPYGVDACGALEFEPGRKDHRLVVNFLRKAGR